MLEFSRLQEIYERDGLLELIRRGLVEILIYSSASTQIRSMLGDMLHLKIYMYLCLGYWPQIQNPRTFNEKIAHRKLFTNNPLFSDIEDKYKVREYVKQKVGNDILPDLYYFTDTPKSIPFEQLPEEYVIKPTHMSGPILFSDEFTNEDYKSVIDNCNSWLDKTYGRTKIEYWYENIKPRVIVEERLYGKKTEVPIDFKLFAFHGEVEYIEVHFDRFTGHKRRIYDVDWNSKEVEFQNPMGPEIPAPNNLEQMIDISEKLGEDFDFIRVDLYEPEDDRIVFGELTVAPGSGADRFVPQKYDFEFGSLW